MKCVYDNFNDEIDIDTAALKNCSCWIGPERLKSLGTKRDQQGPFCVVYSRLTDSIVRHFSDKRLVTVVGPPNKSSGLLPSSPFSPLSRLLVPAACPTNVSSNFHRAAIVEDWNRNDGQIGTAEVLLFRFFRQT